MALRFDSPGTAIWRRSLLRLIDPGDPGDDDGTALRVISTIVTVLGDVLFMGSVTAVMTQWLFGNMPGPPIESACSAGATSWALSPEGLR